jgi:hypothetical protein
MEETPISEKQENPFAKRAARYSIYAPIAAVLLNWLSNSVGMETAQMKLIIGSIIIALFIIGLVMAVIALIGMRKHGKKGILGYAVAGLLINGLVIAGTITLIPALTKVKKAVSGYSVKQLESMPDVFPGSIRIIDDKRGFRFELPQGFKEFDSSTASPLNIYSYLMVIKDGSNISVQVQHLNGILKNEKLDKKQATDSMLKVLPQGSHIEFSEENWKSYTLESFCTEMAFSTGKGVVWTVQVPLAREAIQISVGTSLQNKDEARKVLKQVLESLKGKSNWDIPGSPQSK